MQSINITITLKLFSYDQSILSYITITITITRPSITLTTLILS